MKKFILPMLVLTLFVFLIPFFLNKVNAQEPPTKEITCEEAKKFFQSGECPNRIKLSGMLEIWCYDDEFNGEAKDFQAFTDAIMSRPPSYILDSVSCLEGSEIDQEESEQQNTVQPATQDKPGKDGNPLNIFGINPLAVWRNIQNLLILNEVVVANAKLIVPKVEPEQSAWDKAMKIFNGKEDSEVNVEVDPNIIAHIDEILNRTPEMTEQIIQQYQAEQKALYEGPGESPYRLDIQKGDIAIKLPGQTEWSTLKQGDRIPSGSTIFTGMDSTTVLSIRDKGVIQVQSFTEITVTEKGLEEAAKTGQTYTDIELRTGEVELNVPGGVFTGSLQVHTPNSTTGVRGTHFWVSYDKDKKLSTTGVYKGQVEVKAKGSTQATLVFPNGEKPGVAVVAQKLSTVKLLIAGTVAVLIIGGIVFFLKKRAKNRSRGRR